MFSTVSAKWLGKLWIFFFNCQMLIGTSDHFRMTTVWFDKFFWFAKLFNDGGVTTIAIWECTFEFSQCLIAFNNNKAMKHVKIVKIQKYIFSKGATWDFFWLASNLVFQGGKFKRLGSLLVNQTTLKKLWADANPKKNLRWHPK